MHSAQHPGGLSHSDMWDQICRMPFQQLQQTHDFIYIQKVMGLVDKYTFDSSDSHLANPVYTLPLGKLLKIVASKGLEHVKYLEERVTSLTTANANSEESFRVRIESLNADVLRLREELKATVREKDSGTDDGSGPKGKLVRLPSAIMRENEEVKRLRGENERLATELRRCQRDKEEAQQLLQTRQEDRKQLREENEKIQLEHRHVVSRYKRLLERFNKVEGTLIDFRAREKDKHSDEASELTHLRKQVAALKQENYDLIQSRDRAEELCEQRESQTLRDMTELRRLTKDIVDEERENAQLVRDKFMDYQREVKSREKEVMEQHEHQLGEKAEEISMLRKQVEKLTLAAQRRFDDKALSAEDTSSGSVDIRSYQNAPSTHREAAPVSSRVLSEQRRLEQKNDNLIADVQQLEVRIDVLEEENRRLTRVVKDYERGDEGFHHLRQELTDTTRSVDVLQSENAQLRERLNAMEDSMTFTAALQKLCQRVGVTEDEINSLRPTGSATYSELDAIREENRLLKEEIDWLERERRHWMSKVRLQPLMDTKLRFELGLTSEQLRQLDILVDQMKTGRLIIEEEDVDYKEKYYHELQERRKEASQFNAYVKQRIDDALREALKGLESQETATAVSALKDHIDIITAGPGDASAMSLAQQKAQNQSVMHRLEECELTMEDNTKTIAQLREQLAATVAERDTYRRECEKCREAIFDASATLKGEDGDEGDPEERAEASPAGHTSPAASLLPVRSLSTARHALLTSMREQLTLKESLIASLTAQSECLQKKLEEHRGETAACQATIATLQRQLQERADQLAAVNVMNEELDEQNRELKRINHDLDDTVRGMESGATRELLQKVVLLRRRESTLMQRLRRALSAQAEEASAAQKMRSAMETTFASLREALEGSSTGFVLPPSSASQASEQGMLDYLQQSVRTLLQGKLFRDDSRYLLQLQQIYHRIEESEEVVELRHTSKERAQQVEELQRQLDTQSAELESLKALQGALTNQTSDGKVHAMNQEGDSAATMARWQAEVVSWRQKYTLCATRLGDKEREVQMLEQNLESVNHMLIETKEHVRNLLSSATTNSESADVAAGPPEDSRVFREVARLKSINLGLLHYSLDMQQTIKSMEIDLEGKNQEIQLIKDSGDSRIVSDFVTAAIREHAALRRQGEFALLQAKRLRVQLAATEANFHVVSNEATSYKLCAYRLYRTYVQQMVEVVDYIRCIQRASKGALSPHRAHIMDSRFSRLAQEVDRVYQRSQTLAAQLTDAIQANSIMEERLSLSGLEDNVERKDTTEMKWRESRAKLREAERRITELQEDHHHTEAKMERLEVYTARLTEEIARLEFGCLGTSPLDEEMLGTLLQLKDSVFAKAEAPPVAVQPMEVSANRYAAGTTDLTGDTAIREYTAAVGRQAELSRECSELKRQLEEVKLACSKATLVSTELREETARLQQQLTNMQHTLAEERQKAEVREARLVKSHQLQSDVSRRAAEHNSQCLMAMMSKKEDTIKELQEQLQLEQRKYAEHQLEEAARMEKLHERMFRENSAMIERFKEAISGVGEILPTVPHAPSVSSAEPDEKRVMDQLQSLTNETVRLRAELRNARSTNIILETQLNDQLSRARAALPRREAVPQATPGVAAPIVPQAPESHIPLAASTSPGVDALTDIIHSQSAMIESLRERESRLTKELHTEQQRKEHAERELQAAQMRCIEQGSTLQLVTKTVAATDPPLVQELRAQLASVESELRATREQLEQERGEARRLHHDTEEWKTQLITLQTNVAAQEAEAERARHLASLNEGLKGDLATVREQNDKLMLAATLLKQRLMDEVRRGGDVSRQHQQKIAVAQRMGSIQQESAETMKVLDRRIKLIQTELNNRIKLEEDALKKNEEAQRMVYSLHQQLRAKDREIVELQRRLQSKAEGAARLTSASQGSPSNTAVVEKATQMLPTIMVGSRPPGESSSPGYASGSAPNEALRAASSGAAGAGRPQSAEPRPLRSQVGARRIHSEVQRAKQDQLQEISSLRSRVHRLEADLEMAQDQLKGEREESLSLRKQLKTLRDKNMQMETECAQRTLDSHRTKAMGKEAPGSLPAGTIMAVPTASISPRQSEDIRRPPPLHQQAVDEVRGSLGDQPTLVDSSHVASPVDIREHKKAIGRLEGIIDQLRRRLEVEAPAKAVNLEHEKRQLELTVRRMAHALSAAQGVQEDQIMRIYGSPALEEERSMASMAKELQEQARVNLELRYECETLKIKLRRLQRHMDDIQQVDAFHSSGLSAMEQKEVQSLRTLVEALKETVAALQNENLLLRQSGHTRGSVLQTRRALGHSPERRSTIPGKKSEPATALGRSQRRKV